MIMQNTLAFPGEECYSYATEKQTNFLGGNYHV